MTLTAAALLLGALLGMRYKVLVLLPAIGFVFMTILVVHVARGEGVMAGLMAAAVASICLQVGYLGGILARSGTAASGTTANRPNRAHKTALQS